MKGGIGVSITSLPDGLTVAALMAVNAAGDVVDPNTGAVVAGVRTPDGGALADVRTLVRSGGLRGRGRSGENTTIGVVVTNGQLTKSQATKLAQMAQDGVARAVTPAHTPVDGDAIFAIATGSHAGTPNLVALGALAADVVAEAIVRAVRAAEGLPGLPAARDLEPRDR
jgi:L-aminopeptidase/D-esterase-like protein